MRGWPCLSQSNLLASSPPDSCEKTRSANPTIVPSPAATSARSQAQVSGNPEHEHATLSKQPGTAVARKHHIADEACSLHHKIVRIRDGPRRVDEPAAKDSILAPGTEQGLKVGKSADGHHRKGLRPAPII